VLLAAAVVVTYVAVVLGERNTRRPLQRHEAAQIHSVRPMAREPSSQYGHRIVLNGWDLPRATSN
jgi:hypothetical protein